MVMLIKVMKNNNTINNNSYVTNLSTHLGFVKHATGNVAQYFDVEVQYSNSKCSKEKKISIQHKKNPIHSSMGDHMENTVCPREKC